MWNLQDFIDDEPLVVVQFLNCEQMRSVEYFGFEKVIPGLPIFSSNVKQCSHCMQDSAFKFLTSS